MKKTLLLVAALLAAVSAQAAEPVIVENMQVYAVSPNGEWCVGGDGNYGMVIKNLVTGETYTYQADESHFYATGAGNLVSNNGIVVGSTDNNNAAYWENGEWTELQTLVEGTTNVLHGITADGGIICGNVGNAAWSIDAEKIMCLPALWYRQSNGTYGAPVLLPHPDFDYTGRLPQYISAVSISADGKTVVGQIQDYSGRTAAPLLYTCDDNGDWTYQQIHPELLNPEGVEFPEYPGEFDQVADYADFMTADELAEYEKASDEYFEKLYSLYPPQPEDFLGDENYIKYQEALDEYLNDETGELPYPEAYEFLSEQEKAAFDEAMEEYEKEYNALVAPEYTDFMTDEEKAQYEAAKAQIDEEYNEWLPKYEAFEEALMSCLAYGSIFEFNNIFLSPDGKVVATTRSATIENPDPMAWFPYIDVFQPVVFNLEDDSYKFYAECENFVVSGITDDYSILASHRDGTMPDRAYIIPQANEAEKMPLEDFVAKTSPDNASWMKENMTHQVELLDWDTFEFYTIDAVCTGIPHATPDLSLIVTGTENIWDYESGADYYSYIIPTGIEAGLTAISADDANAPVEFFNLQGIRVAQPAAGNIYIRRQGNTVTKVLVK